MWSPSRASPMWTLPSRPLRRPVDPAHVLREDAPGLDAARDVDAHVALERRADVVRAHRGRDADRRALVASARVERPRDLPLLVEDVAALLDPAGDEHVAVHARAGPRGRGPRPSPLAACRPARPHGLPCVRAPLPGRRSAGTATRSGGGHSSHAEPVNAGRVRRSRSPVTISHERLEDERDSGTSGAWPVRGGTGFRRSGAGRSVTGWPSARRVATSPATSRRARPSGRRSAHSARRRSSLAAPAATPDCRRRSRSSARSAVRRSGRTSSSVARSGGRGAERAPAPCPTSVVHGSSSRHCRCLTEVGHGRWRRRGVAIATAGAFETSGPRSAGIKPHGFRPAESAGELEHRADDLGKADHSDRVLG